MGVDYSAHTIIGLKINEPDLYKVKAVKTCDHDFPQNGKVKFHPETGKKLWKPMAIVSDIVDRDDDWDDELEFQTYEISEYTIGGYELTTMNGLCFICLSKTDSEGSRSSYGHEPSQCGLPTAKEVKDFKKAMTKVKLWSEGDFGMWTMLDAG